MQNLVPLDFPLDFPLDSDFGCRFWGWALNPLIPGETPCAGASQGSAKLWEAQRSPWRPQRVADPSINITIFTFSISITILHLVLVLVFPFLYKTLCCCSKFQKLYLSLNPTTAVEQVKLKVLLCYTLSKNYNSIHRNKQKLQFYSQKSRFGW